MFRKFVIALLLIVLMLSGCGKAPPPEPEVHEPLPPPTAETEPVKQPEPEPPAFAENPAEESSGPSYIDAVTQDIIAKFIQPDMGEYEKAKAAFDYLITSANMTEPIGLELWRVRGDNNPVPSFVENRSLSILLFGVGMCEDYAAALTLLLRGMGLEAQYVPGLTFAADGRGLTDHAWTIAKIDGVWYHLDVQLEQNITRRNRIMYKYFMRSDGTMIGSHRWGRNLIGTGLLTGDQNEEIVKDFVHPDCPQDYPTPPPHNFERVLMPDLAAITQSVKEEIRKYESVHGSLEPMEMNIIPPVFALEGYNR